MRPGDRPVSETDANTQTPMLTFRCQAMRTHTPLHSLWCTASWAELNRSKTNKKKNFWVSSFLFQPSDGSSSGCHAVELEGGWDVGGACCRGNWMLMCCYGGLRLRQSTSVLVSKSISLMNLKKGGKKSAFDQSQLAWSRRHAFTYSQLKTQHSVEPYSRMKTLLSEISVSLWSYWSV